MPPGQFALAHAVLFAVYQVALRYVLFDLGVPARLWVSIKLVGVSLLFAPLALRRWPQTAVATRTHLFGVVGLLFGDTILVTDKGPEKLVDVPYQLVV